MNRRFSVALLAVLLGACGGGQSPPAPPAPSANANLSMLTLVDADLGNVDLDQVFQPTQTDYTAGVGFLISSGHLNALSEDPGATVRVNDTVSGATGIDILLAEDSNTIQVEVTAEDASTTMLYTLTITRETTQQFAQAAYIKASNTDSSDGFGYAVALSGDTLAVSAFRESSSATGINGDQSDNNGNRAGAVYVFTIDGAGVWSQQAYIKTSNAEADDDFGRSVALSGDTLAVGASFEASAVTGVNGDQSNNSANDSGAVYVFTRDTAGVWSQQAYIKASNTDPDDRFGISVALAGDTLAVGAYFEDSAATGVNGDQNNNSANDSGAVYVFTRDAAGIWSQQAYLKASNTGADNWFGYSVALSSNTLVVGASKEDSATTGVNGDQTNNGAIDAGAAYVYTRDTVGVWSQQAYLKASNTKPGDDFGSALALSGDMLAVGAQYEGAGLAGAVYVFTRDAVGVWSEQAYIKPSSTELDMVFGTSVALSGNTLAIGASTEDSAATGINGDENDSNAEFSGAAYVFTRDVAGFWSQQAFVKASNTGASDSFGHSVALAGETLTIGAYFEASAATGINGDQSNNSMLGAGAVYMFE